MKSTLNENDIFILSKPKAYDLFDSGMINDIDVGTVKGLQQIRASGSENFPKHYRDFTNGLYAILNDTKQD